MHKQHSIVKPALFRGAVFIQQSQKYYGNILLIRPLSFHLLTLGFFLTALGIVIFFFVFGFTRKETVSGVLLPKQGLVRVYSPQNGILQERRAQDGQTVQEDDVLFVLSGERVSSRGETQHKVGVSLQSRISSLKADLEHQRTQTLQQQIALTKRFQNLQIQIAQLGGEISLQKNRVEMAEVATKRYADLQQSRFVSEAAVQDKQTEVIDQRSRLATLERNRIALIVKSRAIIFLVAALLCFAPRPCSMS